MKKPIIGVIPLYDEEKESIWMLPGYLDGIKAAGGIPIVLPMDIDEDELAEIDKNIAGYLFTGGHDVSPKLYNEKKQPYCGNPCDERDMMEKMDVNSYHHQAVKEVGNGLNIMAESEDGLVEGIYAPDKKFQWAVQWHPEFIFKKDERQLIIFKAFIDACR